MQKIKAFGAVELRLIFALEQRKRHLFTTKDAKRILKSSDASVWNVLKRLMKKKRVIRLQRGVYLFAPLRSGEKGLWTEDAFAIVPSLVKGENHYVGFVSAMHYWGMTEQLPLVVYVVLTRQKRDLKAVQTRFVFVKKKRLGDVVSVDVGGTALNVSSIEQTILDGLAFPQYALGLVGVAKAIWTSRKKTDWNKLVKLAKKEKSVVQRRLGFLLELLGFKKIAKALEKKFVGFSWLAPLGQKQIFTYSKKWGLKVNENKTGLLAFQEGF